VDRAQGKARKTRKFAEVKRMLNPNDARLAVKPGSGVEKKKGQGGDAKKVEEVKNLTVAPSTMFFSYNSQLGPPYHVILDTNFINFSIQNKLDPIKASMDCLYAKCTIYISDCVMAELEKLGQKYRVALRIAKDPRFERLPCTHKGTYADDCILERITQARCYIVATCDRDLKRRIRKVPGVPIMYISQRKYSVERMPEAWGAPRQ
jgi:U3 small nucleolar RNA-associated protein 24